MTPRTLFEALCCCGLVLQAVIDAIVEAQGNAGGSAAGVVNLGAAAGQLNLQRPVSLAGEMTNQNARPAMPLPKQT